MILPSQGVGSDSQRVLGGPARETPASCPTHRGSAAYQLGPSGTVATYLSLPLSMTH